MFLEAPATVKASVVPAAAVSFAQPSQIVSVKKVDAEQQLVFGEVYAPGIPDSQGDFMTAETIQKMAHDFLAQGRVNKIDVGHDESESGCLVVESFIAREDDTIFIPGSWVLGVKVADHLWPLVKSGELNGFSFGGRGFRRETTLEVDMPLKVSGMTMEADGHDHEFVVFYSEDGDFLGGHTAPGGKNGHMHDIKRGTLTEEAEGHAHRFSFVEGLLAVREIDECELEAANA